MRFLAEVILAVLVAAPWLMGVVWSTAWWKLLAVLFPPYAWYVTAENLMRLGGVL